MSKSTSAAKASTEVAAIATEDGHAIVGGRPGSGQMYRSTTSLNRSGALRSAY